MLIFDVIKLLPLFSCLLHDISGKAFVPCIIGNVNKCMGLIETEYSIPSPDAKLLNVSKQTDNGTCFDMCAESQFCFMAAFVKGNQSCFMYENISYRNVIDQTYLLYYWRCCNTNTSYKVPNRCPGFWKRKSNYITFNSKRPNDPLVTVPNANLYDCQIMCLGNPVCGTVNIWSTTNSTSITCELIMQFPVESLSTAHIPGTSTFIWQCAYNYTLPVPSNLCTIRQDVFPGYWIIESQFLPMKKDLKSLLYFHTYNYESCLENCMKYNHCKRAWYSLMSLFCMLESDDVASCADTQAMNDYEFTTYVWKHCSSNGLTHKVDSTLTKCHKIMDNQYMYIYHSKCGRVPKNVNLIYSCSLPINRNTPLLFTGNFHCQNNQSFRLVMESGKTGPIEAEFDGMKWIRVFTGYESFWLGNVSEINFPESDLSECKIYDANMDSGDSVDLEIIPREGWFAKKPKGSQRPFPKFPVPFLIITDTERPYCNCFTVEACSYQMRVIEDIIEKFYSIPYNFIITGNGVAYKSRGWGYENAANNDEYNPRSMSIAFFGRYENEPGVISLNAVKKIIKLSIEKKKLAENYTLLVLRDVSTLHLPLEGLLRVIELWPHYRGHIRFHCYTLSGTIILLNIFSILLISILIMLAIHICIRRIRHNKYCESVRMCRIEGMYGNLQKSSIKILPEIFQHNLNNLENVNIFISPFTCSLYWIKNIREISYGYNEERNCQCRDAIFSFIDLQRFQSKLVNIHSLTLLQELKTCSKFTMFVSERNSEVDNQTCFILHCDDEKFAISFLSRLYKEECNCLLFEVSKYMSDTRKLASCHRCRKIGRSTESSTSRDRSNLEDQYSFVYDLKNSLRFYRE